MTEEELVVGENASAGGYSLADMHETESQAVDVTQFEGNKVKIEDMEIKEYPSKFHESGMSQTLKVWTEPIGDITFGEEKTPLRANELFNLRIVDGKPAWAEKGNLAELLRKYEVDHPTKLKGVEVTLRVRVPKKKEGETFQRKFLGFM